MAKKILLIEDYEILAKIPMMKITAAGYEARAVASVEEAEKLGSFAADLLIVDHGLEGKQGIDSIPILKKVFPKAKIVILSNFTSDERRKEAAEKGAVDFWSKMDLPFNKLIERVEKVLAD